MIQAKTESVPIGKELGRFAGVTHTNIAPVFILGHGSSGTSILGQSLPREIGSGVWNGEPVHCPVLASPRRQTLSLKQLAILAELFEPRV